MAIFNASSNMGTFSSLLASGSAVFSHGTYMVCFTKLLKRLISDLDLCTMSTHKVSPLLGNHNLNGPRFNTCGLVLMYESALLFIYSDTFEQHDPFEGQTTYPSSEDDVKTAYTHA